MKVQGGTGGEVTQSAQAQVDPLHAGESRGVSRGHWSSVWQVQKPPKFEEANASPLAYGFRTKAEASRAYDVAAMSGAGNPVNLPSDDHKQLATDAMFQSASAADVLTAIQRESMFLASCGTRSKTAGMWKIEAESWEVRHERDKA